MIKCNPHRSCVDSLPCAVFLKLKVDGGGKNINRRKRQELSAARRSSRDEDGLGYWQPYTALSLSFSAVSTSMRRGVREVCLKNRMFTINNLHPETMCPMTKM